MKTSFLKLSVLSLGVSFAALIGGCGAKDSEGGEELASKRVRTYTNNYIYSTYWAQVNFGINTAAPTYQWEFSAQYNGALTQAGLDSQALPPASGVTPAVGLPVMVHIVAANSPWFNPATNVDGIGYKMCVNEIANDGISHWYVGNAAGTGFQYISSDPGSCYYWLNGARKAGQ